MDRLLNKLLAEQRVNDFSSVTKVAVLTSYFNPFGDPRLLENYWRFRESLNVPCFAVELSFQETFETDAELKITGNSNNILWQKEALLNRLMCTIPEEFDVLAWIDADVIFSETSWANQALELLENRDVIQLFSEVDFLDHDGSIQRRANGMGVRRNVQCGLAWAARRDYLRCVGGLYAFAVTGPNDALFADIAFRRKKPTRPYVFGDEFHKDYVTSITDWQRHAKNYLRGTAVNLNGKISHLFHRKRKNAKYKDACELLKTHLYSPRSDIRINRDGALVWTGHNVPLQNAVKNWFQARKKAR